MPQTRRLLTAACVLGLVWPGAALGQEPGVTFDDGPSSKEYAIPLDAARKQTQTKAPEPRAQRPPTPMSAPPTAATPDDDAPAASSSKRARSREEGTDAADTTDTAPGAALPDPPRSGQLGSTGQSSGDGTGAGVVIGGLALAALVLGALAGLVLRRRPTPIDEY